MTYIFIDPSGSFNEGKGHTGIASCNEDFTNFKIDSIAAKDYDSRHLYWDAMISRVLDLRKTRFDTVVIESFMIRTNGFLLGKMPETIQFIGALCWELEKHNINYILQTPTQAKSRFKDSDLVRCIPGMELRSNGRYYFNGKPTNDHVRDALKHLLYFMRYNKNKLGKD